jgi:hypothetical protein
MPPVRFEPTNPASARLQTYALNRAATGIGGYYVTKSKCLLIVPTLKLNTNKDYHNDGDNNDMATQN